MRRDLLLLAVLFSLVAAIRIVSPSDLLTGDQPYQLAYIDDIVIRGNWIVQHLPDGTPAAKPPLYNWLAALPIAAIRAQPEILYKLPSLIAGLATLFLTWDLARRMAGARAALYAGVLLACSTMYSKHVYFARTDMLLTFFVVLQFWAAFQRKPIVFWLAAALSMLTKGPVGVVIVIVSLSALWWWRGELRERWREMHLLVGLLASLIPFVAWFAAALSTGGEAVFDQLVRAETIDRFVAGSSKAKEHRHVLYYVPHFFARMAPASLLAAAALASMPWRRRSEDSPVMMAAFWVATSLVVLSLVPSKRADRLFPLLPAVCILAGWILDRWFSGERQRAVTVILYSIGAIFTLGGACVATHLLPVILLSVTGVAMLAGVYRRRAGLTMTALAMSMLVIIGAYQYWVRPDQDVTSSTSSSALALSLVSCLLLVRRR